MAEHHDTVIPTGSTGFIGSALINKLAGRFALVGLDRAVTHQPPPAAASCRVCLYRPDLGRSRSGRLAARADGLWHPHRFGDPSCRIF